MNFSKQLILGRRVVSTKAKQNIALPSSECYAYPTMTMTCCMHTRTYPPSSSFSLDRKERARTKDLVLNKSATKVKFCKSKTGGSRNHSQIYASLTTWRWTTR